MFLLHVTVRIDKKYNTLSNSLLIFMDMNSVSCLLLEPDCPEIPTLLKGNTPPGAVSLQDDTSQMEARP